MNLKKISKAELESNPQNPRTHTEDDRDNMIKSLIDFPEMVYYIRPIVIGSEGMSLGGNARYDGMQVIRAYTPPIKAEILDDQRIIRKRANATEEQMERFEEAMNYLLYDQDYLVIDVSFLSQEKQEEFIIKDNVPFGSWDYEAVNKIWGNELATSWGLQIPKWIASPDDDDEEEEPKKDKDDHDENVQHSHRCPECGFEFD